MLFKKDINKKIEHLVKKNDFYAVADYVYGTKEEKLDLAKALGTNDNNSSVDLLLRLVDDKDDDVVYAAWAAILEAMIPSFMSSKVGSRRCSAGVT